MRKPIIHYTYHALDFPLQVQMQEAHPSTHFHSHDFVELVIITHGHASHYTADEVCEVQRGDVLLILPGERHAYRNAHKFHLVNVMFTPMALPLPHALLQATPGLHAIFAPPASGQSGVLLHLAESQLPPLMNLVVQLADELARTGADARVQSLALLLRLLVQLARATAQPALPPCNMAPVIRVIEYLEAHHDQAISLHALVQVSGVSERTFFRQFKQYTQLTPIEYLIKYRIDRATELLAMEEMSITAVAQAVGFADSNYFGRQFQRFKRISPRSYRAALLTKTHAHPATELTRDVIEKESTSLDSTA